MQKGLSIQSKNRHSIAASIFWVGVVGLLLVSLYVGYRFYMYGERPPVPLPIAAARTDVSEQAITSAQREKHVVESTHPRYLSIPALSIENARILAMGVKENGELDTPANIFDTGWYRESATPGDGLSALLIDGHNGGPTKDGVFKQLPALSHRDTISIERGDGEIFTYMVKEVKEVSLEELNNGGMKDLSYSIEPSVQGLNLISCTGTWIPAKKTYDKRIIVRAVLQENAN